MQLKEIEKLKVKELQVELRKYDLNSTGKKALLVKRLNGHFRALEKQKQKVPSNESNFSDVEEKTTDLLKCEENNKRKDETPKNEANTISCEHAKLENTIVVPKRTGNIEMPSSTEKEKSSKSVGKTATLTGVVPSGSNNNCNNNEKVFVANSLKRKVEVKNEDERCSKHLKNTSIPFDQQKKQEKANEEHEKANGNGPISEQKPTCNLRIDNFLRPFTLKSVKELVQMHGNFIENGFWMNYIKTHCYVTYPTPEIAAKVKDDLSNKVWPIGGKALCVEFVEKSALDACEAYESEPAEKIRKPKYQAEQRSSKPSHQLSHQPVSIDNLFQKTVAKPALYYLTLTEDEVERKKKNAKRTAGRMLYKPRYRRMYNSTI